MLDRDAYLAALGLSIDDEAMESVKRAESFFMQTLRLPRPEAMFIGTSGDSDEVTKYHNLWLFAPSLVLCAPLHQGSSKEYVVNRRGSIISIAWRLEGCDDLNNLSSSSTVVVRFVDRTGKNWRMSAHGENCRQLIDVVERFVCPGLVEEEPVSVGDASVRATHSAGAVGTGWSSLVRFASSLAVRRSEGKEKPCSTGEPHFPRNIS